MRPKKLTVIGCSSGGKEACEYALPLLKLNSSSVVLAPHIQNKSLYRSLRETLGNHVNGVEYFSPLKAGNIYILDHDSEALSICDSPILKGNRFYLIKSHSNRPTTRPIDNVMINLTDSYQENIIGVVLSGTGGDCFEGAKYIKEHNGKVLVQIENSQITNLTRMQRHREYYYDAMHYCEEMPSKVQGSMDVDFSGSLCDLVNELNSMT